MDPRPSHDLRMLLELGFFDYLHDIVHNGLHHFPIFSRKEVLKQSLFEVLKYPFSFVASGFSFSRHERTETYFSTQQKT